MHPAAASTASGVVRQSIDVRRFSWIRPLVSAYSSDFPSVASLFAGNPADPAAWKDAIARVQALALRVLAERLEHGEATPELLSVSFRAA